MARHRRGSRRRARASGGAKPGRSGGGFGVDRHRVGQRQRGAAPDRRRCPAAARRRRARPGATRSARCRHPAGDAALHWRPSPPARPRSPATNTSWPGAGDGLALEQEGAPLGRAAVLAARDDFLAGIAALLEVDAADELEVHHLRHEPVDRRRLDRARCRFAPRASARPRGRAAGRRRRRPRRRAARRTGPAPCPRRRAGGSPAAPSRSRLPRPRASPSGAVAAVAGQPQSRTSALASLSLHCARSTNIDRRFSVGASTLAEQASRNSSSRRLARPRSWPAGGPWPSRSRRAGPRPGRASRTSLVSWPCRKLAASAPRARITPRSASRHSALERNLVDGMRHYHQPPWHEWRRGGALARSSR